MPSLKAIFATPAKAKHFADHFGVVGLRAQVVHEGKSVTVTTEDAKSFEFVKQMVRDIREDYRADGRIGRFLLVVREAAVTGKPASFDLLDSSSVQVQPDFARRFLSLYENLSDEARRKMCFVMIEGKQSHVKATRFVMDK